MSLCVQALYPVLSETIYLHLSQQVAEHALTSLINLSGDLDVLELLASDDKFLDLVLSFIVVCTQE